MPTIDNGEPGCATPEEAHQVFRNNWDPTSFWECGRQGAPAKNKRCKPNELFSDEQGKCVPWTQWHWTEPSDPPSRPADRERISAPVDQAKKEIK